MPGLGNAVDASTTGFQSLNAATGVWVGRSLIAGTGISITNINGVAGNPTISSTAFTTVAMQTFTANGTYTPTAGMKYCIVEMVGGGAAGGGSPNAAVGQYAAGSGGGAGEYASGVFSAATIGVSQAVTIGAAGVGAAGAAGGNGGNTSLGALITAFGGTGGLVGIAGAVSQRAGGTGGTGGAGGNLRFNGQRGDSSTTSVPGSNFYTGTGGNSFFGSGGLGAAAFSSNGGVASNYGSGGGGSVSSAGLGGGAFTGGNGSGGFIVVTEYI